MTYVSVVGKVTMRLPSVSSETWLCLQDTRNLLINFHPICFLCTFSPAPSPLTVQTPVGECALLLMAAPSHVVVVV